MSEQKQRPSGEPVLAVHLVRGKGEGNWEKVSWDGRERPDPVGRTLDTLEIGLWILF